MIQSWLSDILRCTTCGAVGLSDAGDGLACSNGHTLQRSGQNLLYDAAGKLSSEWSEMQNQSLERYQDESYNDEELPILQLFGGFVAVQLDPGAVVLDLGCGLTPKLPAYVSDLGLSRYIGLEPLAAPVDRTYPCLVGTIAERIPLADESVDAILFATSLDHIEAEDAAISECQRVLKPGGRILFWQGLHEPKYLAASKTFEPIFARGSFAKRAVRIAAGPIEYAHMTYRLWKRARQLRNGERIDNAHCRYYTQEMMTASLNRWGLRELRRVVVPGTASMFVEARI